MLLIRNPLLKSDRIVFTSIDNRWSTDSKTYDEVYTASTGGFPKPEDDSGIFMAIDDSHTLGTHYAIYCSKTMPFTEMMSKIIVGGSPMTGQEILNLDRNSLADQTCYHHLQSLAPSIGAEKTSSLSEVVESKRCTARSIATLAFEKKISIIGKYGYFVPASTSTCSSIIINADYPVKVEDLILPHQSFILSTPDTTIAVVWYQGRVHILEQCGEHKAAWFFNTINFENNNLRSLFTILKSFHQRNGRKGRLVKKSELGKRLNEKQMKKIDSSRTRNLQYQRIAFVDRPRHTQKVLGNLVDKTLCDSYKSRPPFYIQVLDTIFPPRQPPHRSLISTRNS
ncbi:Bgt-50961 [Blumeria graminis f. sp. tritici]|uniref:Bgt-50961 n=1 Tax=Blumeria graminis f. sp. tritici TaxID=62690 RepID=A0A9X9PRP8_BLUGR|nr:Bgt-50961 [Blumeria graminis f. sp. tritici]